MTASPTDLPTDLPALALTDDDGPDPLEDAVWERLRWSGHDRHQSWTWEPDSHLIRCGYPGCDDRVVGAVHPDHLRAVAVGDPAASRRALDAAADGVRAAKRHTEPYADPDLAAALALIDRLLVRAYARVGEVCA